MVFPLDIIVVIFCQLYLNKIVTKRQHSLLLKMVKSNRMVTRRGEMNEKYGKYE